MSRSVQYVHTSEEEKHADQFSFTVSDGTNEVNADVGPVQSNVRGGAPRPLQPPPGFLLGEEAAGLMAACPRISLAFAPFCSAAYSSGAFPY